MYSTKGRTFSIGTKKKVHQSFSDETKRVKKNDRRDANNLLSLGP